MTLDALGDGAVELQLDSPGGSLEAAWTIIDVIDLLGVPVNIVCSGRVEGAAVGVLSAGGTRTALPHARFRLSDPELEISGRARELAALLEHHSKRLALLHERIAACTGRPVGEVAADFRGRAVARRERIAPLPAHRRDRGRKGAYPLDWRAAPSLGPSQKARWQWTDRLQAGSTPPDARLGTRSHHLGRLDNSGPDDLRGRGLRAFFQLRVRFRDEVADDLHVRRVGR